MGSVCCVAARPHGSNATSADWSMGPNEHYWRSDTSYSPPPSRWDFRIVSEEFPSDLHDDNLVHGSSTSSNSEDSRWLQTNHLISHPYSASEVTELFLSSPSDHCQGPQWTPPVIQEISVDDCETATRRGQILGRLPSTFAMEGNSANPESDASAVSCSDGDDSEPIFTSCFSSRRNFLAHKSFMSKPVHPMAFPGQTPVEASNSPVVAFTGSDSTTPERDGHCLSSSNSTEFVDVSEPPECETLEQSSVSSEGFKCGLCQRFLSQRSPWSSCRIVRTRDMPVAGVLSCRHIFHAECLEQMTPMVCKSDPPCPLCVRIEEENSPEQQAFSRLRNSFLRLRPFSEDGPSRSWERMQVKDGVEGTLHSTPRNALMLLNQNRIKRNLSLKGNSGKEFSGKLKKNGLYSSQFLTGQSVDLGAIRGSMATAGLSARG